MPDSSHLTRGYVFAGMTHRSTTAKRKGLSFLPGGPNNALRNHIIAMCGEFAGTFLFLFFAFTGTQVANSQTQGTESTTIAQGSNPAQLLYISLCFGFSLAVNAWVFFRISGGLFNPAVTFGMVIVGAVPPLRGALIVVSQMVGGIAAAGIVDVMYPGQLNVRTSLGAGTTKTQGLFIEMFLTAELVFTIFMLAAEKHKGTFIAPIGIGLALFIAELSGKLTLSCPRVIADDGRCLLHRRLAQPSPIIRSGCDQSHIRGLSLGKWSTLTETVNTTQVSTDILGWSSPRLSLSRRVLHPHQTNGIRNRQPRPRLRRERNQALRP